MEAVADPVAAAVVSSLLGIAFVGFLVRSVLRTDQGTETMRQISAAVKEGALAFLHREYQVLAFFVLVITLVLALVPSLGGWVALAFLFGAVSSAASGYAGMNMAIRANARTAAATQSSLNQGLKVAFRSGAVMGITVVSIGILGLSILYFAFHNNPNFLKIIPAYGFGASGVALFARVGGGIYTKGADAGADLVGKVEAGIPEDDPRNAAVIADLVGDNVGDVAGMGADLFESYVDSIIATMTLSIVAVTATRTADKPMAWHLPLIVAAGGILASILGVFLVRVGEKAEMGALLAALRRGVLFASVLAALFSLVAVWALGADVGVFWAILAGLVAGVLIGESTNYFTSYAYSPTRRIADASTAGAGTTVIRGFANGLLSSLPAVVLIAAAVIVANRFADMYGVAIAGVGMLSTLGITLATDAYGPVADNAGGIVEMSGLPPEVRQRTDALDSLGNTTAATGKGFAIGSAALTALALLLSYAQVTGLELAEISLLNVPVVVGLLLGIMLPAIFCSLALTAVSDNAFLIVHEVRRQFREIPGLMEGKARPEYGRCVDISTRGALRRMVLPALMAIGAPVVVGFLLGAAGLGGFLMGAIGSGFLLAVTMANAGGSWDNAKKWLEAGNHGGKGSEAHKAGVVGDTVGDPMKDTAGPSLNIMIKLMSIIALVFAPVLSGVRGLF